MLIFHGFRTRKNRKRQLRNHLLLNQLKRLLPNRNPNQMNVKPKENSNNNSNNNNNNNKKKLQQLQKVC
jgi:hypothetical protein